MNIILHCSFVDFRPFFNLVMLFAAGYLHIIHQMKELITGAGKKAYTLVMGKPNPAKLANFPEVFIRLRTLFGCFFFSFSHIFTGRLIP